MEKMEKRVFKWFSAIDVTALGRKTRKIALVNNHSGDVLGYLSWYPTWRQYCFFPEPNTVWSGDCVADVNELWSDLDHERLMNRQQPMERERC